MALETALVVLLTAEAVALAAVDAPLMAACVALAAAEPTALAVELASLEGRLVVDPAAGDGLLDPSGPSAMAIWKLIKREIINGMISIMMQSVSSVLKSRPQYRC
jgi:hypothetical protein